MQIPPTAAFLNAQTVAPTQVAGYADPRLRVLHNPTNLGIPASRNRGLLKQLYETLNETARRASSCEKVVSSSFEYAYRSIALSIDASRGTSPRATSRGRRAGGACGGVLVELLLVVGLAHHPLHLALERLVRGRVAGEQLLQVAVFGVKCHPARFQARQIENLFDQA